MIHLKTMLDKLKKEIAQTTVQEPGVWLHSDDAERLHDIARAAIRLTTTNSLPDDQSTLYRVSIEALEQFGEALREP